MAFARAADAPVHVVHLSSAAALDQVRRAKAAGVRVTAETCPHYLVLTDARYDEPDPRRRAPGTSSRRRSGRGGPRALWAGLADGSLDLVATDHVPDRVVGREGRRRPRRPVRPDQQRRARDRDAARDRLLRGRRERADHRRADGRPARDDPGRRFGLPRRARSRSAATRTSSCSTRRRAGRSAQRTCTTRATTRRTRGSRSTGAVRDVFVRGRPVDPRRRASSASRLGSASSSAARSPDQRSSGQRRTITCSPQLSHR